MFHVEHRRQAWRRWWSEGPDFPLESCASVLFHVKHPRALFRAVASIPSLRSLTRAWRLEPR